VYKKKEPISKLIIVTDATVRIPDANKPGRPSSGKAACGYLFLNGEKSIDKIVTTGGKYLGDNLTVPESEYRGVIFALDHASSFCRWEIEVWSDSSTVINHLNGTWRMNVKHIKQLFDEVKSLERRFESVSYYHHSRYSELAKEADRIADQHFTRAQG